MKKYGALTLLLLLSVTGCGWRKAKKDRPKGADIRKNVDIPLVDDAISSFFDADIKEFALADDIGAEDVDITANDEKYEVQDFAWVEEAEEKTGEFEVVYFGFDRYSIRECEEDKVARDIDLAVAQLRDHKKEGREAKIVIEGHACHSAGSDVYNLALSEKRAKALADRFVASGVSRDAIKIVGRGVEKPAILNGVEVTGGRTEQRLNRRDEVRVINA